MLPSHVTHLLHPGELDKKGSLLYPQYSQTVKELVFQPF